MKQTYSIELNERQYQALEAIVEQYGLPDVSKALRCMVDFAISNPEQKDTIFEEIRCLDC